MINFKCLSSGNEERIYDYLNNLCNYQECFCNKVYIRFLHAVVGAPAVDIYVDGIIVASGLEYGQITQYVLSYPGNYQVSVYISNQKENPLLEGTVELYRNTGYTAAVAGNLDGFDLYLIKEYKEEKEPINEAVVCYTNLSPENTAFDLCLSDNTIIYKGVSFSESMPNVALIPTQEKFSIKYTKTKEIVASTVLVELKKNTYYSIFSIGEGKDIELFIILSGLSYLDLC
ncbi:DUF4397 domain-containing protein [Sedimentibacter sp. zth1]|uniref:DUF4397 domain-containing protein n=1 Tax=Sedimentibacter sp. zth1 TaxID=2816908 RepID=UPI001A9169F4|nr:DUF4397 domain-containing protein [Sedimentibacter sp. zth1]QSX04942.1 DUF4397 domain-containing protein [Sedimentibacter sp. zth1]